MVNTYPEAAQEVTEMAAEDSSTAEHAFPLVLVVTSSGAVTMNFPPLGIVVPRVAAATREAFST